MNRERIRRFVLSRTHRAFLTGMALVVVGYTVWPGCALAPLPSKRLPISGRTTAQFKLKEFKELTRTDVTTQLGLPDAYLTDSRIACYRVNTVHRRKVFLFLFVIPVSIESSLAHDIGFVQFDEQERVRRAGIRTVPDGDSLYDAAWKWRDNK
jgi:hypothetical protein